jgi:hypothetical protein
MQYSQYFHPIRPEGSLPKTIEFVIKITGASDYYHTFRPLASLTFEPYQTTKT